MKLLKRTFYFLPALCFYGCITIDAPGLNSGYAKLDETSRSMIVFEPEGTDLCKLSNDHKVHAIKASQLLECLAQTDSSIVYLWSPHCKSDDCISLLASQQYCDTNNYRLFLVTEYYDMEMIALHNITPTPTFSVNQLHYKTDRKNRYTKLFTKELTRNKRLSKDESFYRFHVFVKDSLARKKRNLFKP